MQVLTSGETTKDTYQFANLFNQHVNELKTFTNDAGEQITKTAPDGRPVFRTALKALRVKENQINGEDNNVTLGLLTQPEIEAGKIYRLSGKTWITHYVTNNNRLGVSIIAETIKAM
jgi:hypothetical protein